MKKEEIKVCIVRMEGTNCEDETERAFRRLNVFAEKVHLKQLTGDSSGERRRKLSDYQALIIPGGFSAGDYIRSGAVFASLMQSKLEKEVREFANEGKIIGGICNGFQVLTSAGLLPGNIEAALTTNASSKFEGGFNYVKHLRKTPFTENVEIGKVLNFAHGHGEGRLLFVPGKDKQALKELQENNQIVFRFCTPAGEFANGKYPFNPNGTTFDIAGICNLGGNVVGWMPHPERVQDPFNHYDFHRNNRASGDGMVIFESIIEYLQKKF
ncbi:TPA: phosphoribosylformylglycinamidine synthase I [archaeon]|uniref:Phosphoribosylformylglycinamidine synthase subunit PurQ n=1 Tax=Candidatus Naiadarchaeum limnaeum TaxID=2756139 RepID=A0A832V9M1_9ARCH|nr:phosphoribosylformylglycinamidine synthase I [Candidatus Naiadarchaeum limnaeum]